MTAFSGWKEYANAKKVGENRFRMNSFCEAHVTSTGRSCIRLYRSWRCGVVSQSNCSLISSSVIDST